MPFEATINGKSELKTTIQPNETKKNDIQEAAIFESQINTHQQK